MDDFFARYRETEAAMNAYVTTLPLWVNVWRGWMFTIFPLGAVFVFRKVEPRWMAAAMISSLFAYNVVSMLHGVGRFPSIAFVLLWGPLAVYFLRRRGQQHGDGWFDRAYALWFRAATATLCISVGFDIYNVLYAWVRGVA
jgi:hypothetical protein